MTKRILRLLPSALCLSSIVLSGCASIPGINTHEGAAGVIKSVRPEYAGQIDQIANLLVGKRANPVEGFAREERWFLKGDEVNPNDLRLEVLYRNAFQVTPSMMTSRPVAPIGETSDAELRAEIEAILRASGVAQ